MAKTFAYAPVTISTTAMHGHGQPGQFHLSRVRRFQVLTDISIDWKAVQVCIEFCHVMGGTIHPIVATDGMIIKTMEA